MEMPEAVRRVTSLPAGTFGLRQRGMLKDGYYADIVIFDGEEIIDRATFEEPFNLSAGIKYVFVNGVIAFKDGRLTGKRQGRILRNGGLNDG